MLWSTLFNRVGKVPLRISQHRHVTAIIDGETVFLDIKYKSDGTPYLVKAPAPLAKRKFKPGDLVRHTGGWKGEIAGLTPDPEYYYVKNLDDWPFNTTLLHVRKFKKIDT